MFNEGRETLCVSSIWCQLLLHTPAPDSDHALCFFHIQSQKSLDLKLRINFVFSENFCHYWNCHSMTFNFRMTGFYDLNEGWTSRGSTMDLERRNGRAAPPLTCIHTWFKTSIKGNFGYLYPAAGSKCCWDRGNEQLKCRTKLWARTGPNSWRQTTM
jgi:hypothetical protein